MNCPVCGITLQMADRQGIEIDYCPQCRGVWLDRGELDKIIERSTANERSPGRDSYESPPTEARRDNDYRRHKKKSFWGEVFDFD